MPNILKFRYPDKKATDPLLRSDPMPDSFGMSPEARLIYLRIIDESIQGVLLRCDRLACELAASATALSLSKVGVGIAEGELESLAELYSSLLLPELGQEYITQIRRQA